MVKLFALISAAVAGMILYGLALTLVKYIRSRKCEQRCIADAAEPLPERLYGSYDGTRPESHKLRNSVLCLCCGLLCAGALAVWYYTAAPFVVLGGEVLDINSDHVLTHDLGGLKKPPVPEELPRGDVLWNTDTLSNGDLRKLARMPNLRHLTLGDYEIGRGNDLSPIGEMTGLETLCVLDGNGADISLLRGLTNMRYLFLRNWSGFDGSGAFDGMNELEALTIFGAEIPPELLRSLSEKERLTGLCLAGCTVADPAPLGDCKGLEYLCLSGTDVADISFAAGLESLYELDLSYTEIADFSPLAGLDSLEMLHITDIPSEDFSALTEIPNLRLLIASEEQIPMTVRSRLEDKGVKILQPLYNNCYGGLYDTYRTWI